MKEIDKIRIRQWNQDNPYIQMKNLENAQPGYRVHTVNDDHHLYELPLAIFPSGSGFSFTV